MRLVPIPEDVVRKLAEACGPDSAAQKVLDEAEEIRSRGSIARFGLTDEMELCVQEGVVLK